MHVAVLRFLGGPGQVQGYLWPYSSLCRTCAESALLPPLWRHIDLSDGPVCGGGGGGGGGLLDLLRRSGRNVERLVLCGRAEVDDAFVEGLAELLAGGPLRSLDLGGCPRLKGATLRHLHKAPLLEELSVECLASLDDQLLAEVCGCCPRLHSLSVRFCEGLTDAAALLERPGGWRALQFDGCFRLDVTSLLAEPHGAWQRLEDLSLDGEDLEAQQLALIAPSFPRLRCLVISFARELDSGSAECTHTHTHMLLPRVFGVLVSASGSSMKGGLARKCADKENTLLDMQVLRDMLCGWRGLTHGSGLF